VNTETTDKQDSIPVQGWVGYDDDCGLCVGLLKRFGGPFERRGFVFVPLQNPWLAGRLGLKPGEMPEEMKMLWPDGRSIGGTEAIVALLRAAWWTAPLGWIAWLPPLRPVMRAAYRWVARNRHTLGICRIPDRTGHPHHGHAAFFETP
jgi:predicted DCC family thiol-disulfide oxidoreductase YuxK